MDTQNVCPRGMKCPACKQSITTVNVFSECRQIADVDEEGNITDYGSVEDIADEAQDVECPKCNASIIDHIKSFS